MSIKSECKKALKSSGMWASSEAIDKLAKIAEDIIKERTSLAETNAKNAGRKTIMPADLEADKAPAS